MSIVGFLGLVASLVFPQWSYLFGVLIGIWLVHFDRHLTKRAGDTATPSDNATVLHK